jgi:hypothetical protein
MMNWYVLFVGRDLIVFETRPFNSLPSYHLSWHTFTVSLDFPRRTPGKYNHTSNLRYNVFSETNRKVRNPKSISLHLGTRRFTIMELKFRTLFWPTFTIWNMKRDLWALRLFCSCIPPEISWETYEITFTICVSRLIFPFLWGPCGINTKFGD